MIGSWSGLELARRALQANQQALDLTGRNVANASTRGYSRQSPSFVTLPPYHIPLGLGSGQIGTGVENISVIRYRDEYLDRQYRQRAADFGAAETWVRVLDEVEQVWGEPGSAGLQTYLNRFWDALKGLAARPGEPDARVQVIESARALVGQVQDMQRHLDDLRWNLDAALTVKAEEVNNIAREIASLNQQIMEAHTAGLAPNDLRDKRDLLLDHLARLTGATWVHNPDGQTTVYLNSQALVVGRQANGILVDRSAAPGFAKLVWDTTNIPVTFRGGEMAALQEARDVTLPDKHIAYLETLMGNLTREFNALHATGYYPSAGPPGANTGELFFTVTYLDPPANTRADLATLAVNLEPGKVSAALNPAADSLDGGMAEQLADLLTGKIVLHPLTGLQPVSIMDFHRAVVGELGVLSQRQRTAESTFGLQLQQADGMRQSISGVSLDEEMTKMIEYQRSYAAAARLATTMDELLETIIHRMGLVGR